MVVVRDAQPDDVVAIRRFGEAHVRPHCAPLIGEAAADEQVRRWWSEEQVGAAVAGGLVVAAEVDGQVVGLGIANVSSRPPGPGGRNTVPTTLPASTGIRDGTPVSVDLIMPVAHPGRR